MQLPAPPAALEVISSAPGIRLTDWIYHGIVTENLREERKMTVRGSSFFVILAALSFVALGAAPAAAQQSGDCEGIPHCGPYVDPPGDPCNGPNDPFCNGGGGGGGTIGPCAKCARKTVLFNTFYACCTTAEACDTLQDQGYFVPSQGYVWCQALANRCNHGDDCGG